MSGEPIPAQPACAPDDIEIAQVTAHGWRLTDRHRAEHDPYRLLAYIERRDRTFEVFQLGTGLEWHEFDSLDRAVLHVLETGPRLVSARVKVARTTRVPVRT